MILFLFANFSLEKQKKSLFHDNRNWTHGQCKNSQVTSKQVFCNWFHQIVALSGLQICWIARSLDCQIIRLLDQYIIRLLDRQIVKSLDSQIIRSLDRQIVTSIDHQVVKLLDHQMVRSLGHQIIGSLDCWISRLLNW